MNNQLTEPARVHALYVNVMERRPDVSPDHVGTGRIITTLHTGANRDPAAYWDEKEKHMNDHI